MATWVANNTSCYRRNRRRPRSEESQTHFDPNSNRVPVGYEIVPRYFKPPQVANRIPVRNEVALRYV